MRCCLSDNFRDPAALARFVLTAAVGLAVDLWSKWYAFATLEPTKRVYALVPGWLHFQTTGNRGAVFGMGQGRVALFIAVSVLAIGFLTWLFAASGRQRFYQFVLGLLMAGVLGNLYDRAVHGYVRDMILALPKWGVFPWIFNVADILLCCGVGLMVAYSLLHKPTPVAAAANRLGPLANESPRS